MIYQHDSQEIAVNIAHNASEYPNDNRIVDSTTWFPSTKNNFLGAFFDILSQQ